MVRWVSSIFGTVASMVVTVVSFWLVGAATALAFAPGMLGTVVAAIAAALMAVIIPIAADIRLTRSFRKVDPHARSTTFQTLFVLNLVVAGVLLLLFPAKTRATLEQRGEWAFAGDPERPGSLQLALRKVTPKLPRNETKSAEAPEPSRPAVPRSAQVPTPSALPPALTGPAPGSSAGQTRALAPVSSGPIRTGAARVFEQRAPSVVVIRTRSTPAKGSLESQLLGHLGIKHMAGMGSGFVIESGGADGAAVILTNRHVIAGAKTLEIALRDGRRFDRVERLLEDARNDLALLRVAGLELSAIPIAEAEPAPGDRAIAIGSPLGLEFTLTDGIVSAVRSIEGTKFIQMQTEIAPGSSGGPLLDESGSLIGVNTATKGASLNLAVQATHVRALLKKPRTPHAYPPFERGPEVTAIAYEGFEPEATARIQARGFFEALAASLEGCAKNVGPNARIRQPLSRSVLAQDRAATGVGVPQETLDCLRVPLRMIGFQLGHMMSSEQPEPSDGASEISATAEFSLVPDADAGIPSSSSVTIQFILG